MFRTIGVLGLAALLALATGCGGSGMQTVSGTVTLNGKSLEEGDILFTTSDGAHGPMPGKVKDGRFELKARTGMNRVEISSPRIVPGGARGAGGEPVPEETIPEQYNGPGSKLTADVTPSGPNSFEFNLVGKRK